MTNRRADWYLQEYKEQWEQFLGDRPEQWEKVSTESGASLGVYETKLSPFVALRIGTSLTCGDKVCDYAQASIKTYLYAIGGGCEKNRPSTNQAYLNGILSNTQHSTGLKWRKRIDSWKRNVGSSIDTAISEYKSDKANFDLLAQNANKVCSGESIDVSQSRELLRLRATYWAMDTLLKQQISNNSTFGVDWLEKGLSQLTAVANRVKKTGLVDPGSKKFLAAVYQHKAFGTQLLNLAQSWLKKNSSDGDFKGKLANRQAVRKVLRRRY